MQKEVFMPTVSSKPPCESFEPAPPEVANTSSALLEAFEAQTLTPGEFHHREHVEIVWLYLQRFPLLVALEKIATGIQKLAVKLGADGLYHETITWAYAILVQERIQHDPLASWPEFVDANPDLLTWKPSILNRYYREETLWSDRARQSFLLPDRLQPGDVWPGDV